MDDYANATRSAVQQVQAKGLKATLVNMSSCPSDGAGGYACDGCATHPGIAGHRGMFEYSYSTIKATMGW